MLHMCYFTVCPPWAAVKSSCRTTVSVPAFTEQKNNVKLVGGCIPLIANVYPPLAVELQLRLGRLELEFEDKKQQR